MYVRIQGMASEVFYYYGQRGIKTASKILAAGLACAERRMGLEKKKGRKSGRNPMTGTRKDPKHNA